MTLYDELNGVLEALDQGGIDYALVGALAVAVWGAPRATKDIDLLLQKEDLPRALAAVAARGFTLEGLPFEFKDGTEIQRVNKVDAAGNLMTLDLMIVDKNLAPVWASRSRLPFGERKVSVVSRDALIAMKARAARPQGHCRHPEPEGHRPMRAEMSPAAIEARLREVSQMAGSLRPEARLATKIDLSAAGVAARLREASDLYDVCSALARARSQQVALARGRRAAPPHPQVRAPNRSPCHTCVAHGRQRHADDRVGVGRREHTDQRKDHEAQLSLTMHRILLLIQRAARHAVGNDDTFVAPAGG